MQLAEGCIGAIAAQHLGLRCLRYTVDLVLVAQHELAGLERFFVRIRAGDAATLDCRMGDSISKTEHIAQVSGGMHVLLPDWYDAGQIAYGFAGMVNSLLQTGCVGRQTHHHEVEVSRAQWFLPVLGSVLTHVPQFVRTCSHALLKLGR